MNLTLGLRLEIHDAKCPLCGEGMPTEQGGRPHTSTCWGCQQEDASLGPIAAGPHLDRMILDIAAARKQRRKENEV